ncbi:GerAB/ArcD/ProY family transporter [Oscillospiraceae bacterium PP1C4]
MQKLGRWQVFCLFVLFELGTALYPAGIAAKQDAWIVIIVSSAISILVLYLYLKLQELYPDKNLIEIIFACLGRKFGIPLGMLYSLFFFNATARSAFDFTSVIGETLINKTPHIVINFTFVAATVFIIWLGIETVGRMGQVMLVTEIFALFFIIAMVILGRNADFHELLPIMGEGVMPIIKIIPNTVIFPFSEVFVFLTFLHLANPDNKMKKVLYTAQLVVTVLLVLITVFIIATLSVEYAAISTYPLIEIVRIIDVEEVITNLDAVSIVIIFMGGIIKETVYFYATAVCICSSFSIKNKKLVYIVLGVVIAIYSSYFEKRDSEHILIGLKIIPQYISPLFFLSIPLLMFLILRLKKHNKWGKAEGI